MQLTIINGPNLNLLGIREPKIYGTLNFESFFEDLKLRFPSVNFDYFQSNGEGAIVTKIQDCNFICDGIVLNAAAYTHTSIAIADAVAAINCPVIEVHISNIFSRENFRKYSMLSPYCHGTITGLGLEGYALAVSYFLKDKKKINMDSQVNEAIALKWFEAFNEHDLEKLLSLYDNQAAHFSPKLKSKHPETNGLIVGKTNLRKWWAEAFKNLPELHYKMISLTANNKRVFTEYLRQVPGEQELNVAEVLDINADKITSSRVYHG